MRVETPSASHLRDYLLRPTFRVKDNCGTRRGNRVRTLQSRSVISDTTPLCADGRLQLNLMDWVTVNYNLVRPLGVSLTDWLTECTCTVVVGRCAYMHARISLNLEDNGP